MRVLRSARFMLILLTVIAIDLPRSCRAAGQTEAVSANELSPDISSGITEALAAIFSDEHIPESAVGRE